jgi:hypothetical protein
MLPLVYSVALPQAFGPLLSAGYTLMANEVLPLGKFIFAASHIKLLLLYTGPNYLLNYRLILQTYEKNSFNSFNCH